MVEYTRVRQMVQLLVLQKCLSSVKTSLLPRVCRRAPHPRAHTQRRLLVQQPSNLYQYPPIFSNSASVPSNICGERKTAQEFITSYRVKPLPKLHFISLVSRTQNVVVQSVWPTLAGNFSWTFRQLGTDSNCNLSYLTSLKQTSHYPGDQQMNNKKLNDQYTSFIN